MEKKTWNSDAIKIVSINGEDVFKINVSNSQSNTITLDVKTEGEYSEHLVVVDSIQNETLYISSNFQPLFKDDNDKLSAHKVLSIEYVITVPKHIILEIKSNIASVEISGNYLSTFIELAQGNCSLNNFLGNAVINSIDGNITIETNNAKIDAFTKTGIKSIHQFKYGEHLITCKSINGNIIVQKIEK